MIAQWLLSKSVPPRRCLARLLQKQLDAAAKAQEDAEQAALPYKWTQTIKDVDVTIAVDAKYKGRDLDVKLTRTHLKVAVKGQEPIIDVHTLTSTSHVI